LQATRLRRGRKRVNYEEFGEDGEERVAEDREGMVAKKNVNSKKTTVNVRKKVPSRRVTREEMGRGKKRGRREEEEEEGGGYQGSSDDSDSDSDDSSGSWSEGDEDEDENEDDDEDDEEEEAYEGESDNEEEDEEGWDEEKVYSVFTTTARQRAAAVAAAQSGGGGGNGGNGGASEGKGLVPSSSLATRRLKTTASGKSKREGKDKGKANTFKMRAMAAPGGGPARTRRRKGVVEEEEDFPELLPSSSPSSSLRLRCRGRNPPTSSSSVPSPSSSSPHPSLSLPSLLLLLPQHLLLSSILPFLAPQPDFLNLAQACSPLLLFFDQPCVWSSLPPSLPPFDLRYSSLSQGRTARGRLTKQPMDICMLKLMVRLSAPPSLLSLPHFFLSKGNHGRTSSPSYSFTPLPPLPSPTPPPYILPDPSFSPHCRRF